MTTSPPLYAVLAVDLRDPTTGTVVSLHGSHDSADWAQQGYRRFARGDQPALYVIEPVPHGTPIGAAVARLEQCTARARQTQERCREPAIRGTHVCWRHGG
jgi:hypothetical protein